MENMIWDHLMSPLQNLSSLAKSEIRELQKSFPPLHPTLVHGAYFSYLLLCLWRPGACLASVTRIPTERRTQPLLMHVELLERCFTGQPALQTIQEREMRVNVHGRRFRIPPLARRMSKRPRCCGTSCGRRGAGCPCDSEKSWSNIQLRRKYKEGNYDRGHFDGSPVQQQPHQGSGGAHQDQRVRRQLPALRPHRLQLREQGQPDRVQPGGVQGNQLPRWLTCPNIAWKLLPRHKPLPRYVMFGIFGPDLACVCR